MTEFRVPVFVDAEDERVRWPDGKRLAVWLIPNVEAFRIDKPIPGVSNEVPNVPGFAGRDYGGRVGYWRVAAVLEEFGVPASVALNSDVCSAYPEVTAHLAASGWEMLGHNASNSERLVGLGQEREREVIVETLGVIAEATGRRPRGWLSSGLQQSPWTLPLLAEAGVEYVSDWINDDRPYLLVQGDVELLSVPYTMEINDKGIFERHGHPAGEYVDRAKRQFDVLYREGATVPRVMALAVHPYLMGQPHRIDCLREVLDYVLGHEGVWFTTGGAIADAYRGVAWRRRPPV
jgi:allantoinase